MAYTRVYVARFGLLVFAKDFCLYFMRDIA